MGPILVPCPASVPVHDQRAPVAKARAWLLGDGQEEFGASMLQEAEGGESTTAGAGSARYLSTKEPGKVPFARGLFSLPTCSLALVVQMELKKHLGILSNDAPKADVAACMDTCMLLELARERKLIYGAPRVSMMENVTGRWL